MGACFSRPLESRISSFLSSEDVQTRLPRLSSFLVRNIDIIPAFLQQFTRQFCDVANDRNYSSVFNGICLISTVAEEFCKEYDDNVVVALNLCICRVISSYFQVLQLELAVMENTIPPNLIRCQNAMVSLLNNVTRLSTFESIIDTVHDDLCIFLSIPVKFSSQLQLPNILSVTNKIVVRLAKHNVMGLAFRLIEELYVRAIFFRKTDFRFIRQNLLKVITALHIEKSMAMLEEYYDIVMRGLVDTIQLSVPHDFSSLSKLFGTTNFLFKDNHLFELYKTMNPSYPVLEFLLPPILTDSNMFFCLVCEKSEQFLNFAVRYLNNPELEMDNKLEYCKGRISQLLHVMHMFLFVIFQFGKNNHFRDLFKEVIRCDKLKKRALENMDEDDVNFPKTHEGIAEMFQLNYIWIIKIFLSIFANLHRFIMCIHSLGQKRKFVLLKNFSYYFFSFIVVMFANTNYVSFLGKQILLMYRKERDPKLLSIIEDIPCILFIRDFEFNEVLLPLIANYGPKDVNLIFFIYSFLGTSLKEIPFENLMENLHAFDDGGFYSQFFENCPHFNVPGLLFRFCFSTHGQISLLHYLSNSLNIDKYGSFTSRLIKYDIIYLRNVRDFLFVSTEIPLSVMRKMSVEFGDILDQILKDLLNELPTRITISNYAHSIYAICSLFSFLYMLQTTPNSKVLKQYIFDTKPYYRTIALSMFFDCCVSTPAQMLPNLPSVISNGLIRYNLDRYDPLWVELFFQKPLANTHQVSILAKENNLSSTQLKAFFKKIRSEYMNQEFRHHIDGDLLEVRAYIKSQEFSRRMNQKSCKKEVLIRELNVVFPTLRYDRQIKPNTRLVNVPVRTENVVPNNINENWKLELSTKFLFLGHNSDLDIWSSDDDASMGYFTPDMLDHFNLKNSQKKILHFIRNNVTERRLIQEAHMYHLHVEQERLQSVSPEEIRRQIDELFVMSIESMNIDTLDDDIFTETSERETTNGPSSGISSLSRLSSNTGSEASSYWFLGFKNNVQQLVGVMDVVGFTSIVEEESC
ncbi:hypothetical protein PCE1_003546 [Barthelona sp. PCE]